MYLTYYMILHFRNHTIAAMYHILDVLIPLQAISQYNHKVHPSAASMEYISVKIYPHCFVHLSKF